jgi:hypothetical protein
VIDGKARVFDLRDTLGAEEGAAAYVEVGRRDGRYLSEKRLGLDSWREHPGEIRLEGIERAAQAGDLKSTRFLAELADTYALHLADAVRRYGAPSVLLGTHQVFGNPALVGLSVGLATEILGQDQAPQFYYSDNLGAVAQGAAYPLLSERGSSSPGRPEFQGRRQPERLLERPQSEGRPRAPLRIGTASSPMSEPAE